MADKKKLLISWGSAYTFNEIIVPIIKNLAKTFSISVILVDFYMPSKVLNLLKDMDDSKLIESYWIVPDQKHILKYLWFIRSNLKIWRDYCFDVFLSISATEIIDRSLIKFALPRHCVKICFWSGLGYLLKNNKIVKQAFGNLCENEDVINKQAFEEKRKDIVEIFMQKLKRSGSFSVLFKKFIKISWFYSYGSLKKKSYYFLKSFLLSGLLLGRFFPQGKREKLANILMSDIDTYIFCDEIEARIFASFSKGKNVQVVEHPTQSICCCERVSKEKKSILVPFGGLLVGLDELPEEEIAHFYRDIRTVVNETKADSVHLRLHPRHRGSLPYLLRAYLKEKGVNAECVKPDKPFREIVCEYLGVVGFASTSLRDARAACDYVVVVGFEAISKYYYANPKRMFGNGEGYS